MSKFNVGNKVKVTIVIPAQDGYPEHKLEKVVEVMSIRGDGTYLVHEEDSAVLSEFKEDQLLELPKDIADHYEDSVVE